MADKQRKAQDSPDKAARGPQDNPPKAGPPAGAAGAATPPAQSPDAPAHQNAAPQAGQTPSGGGGTGAPPDYDAEGPESQPPYLDASAPEHQLPGFSAGMLLTAADLKLLLDYVVQSQRQAHRELHGRGVLHGLNVRKVSAEPGGGQAASLCIEPGVAIDGHGNLVEVKTQVHFTPKGVPEGTRKHYLTLVQHEHLGGARLVAANPGEDQYEQVFTRTALLWRLWLLPKPPEDYVITDRMSKPERAAAEDYRASVLLACVTLRLQPGKPLEIERVQEEKSTRTLKRYWDRT